MNYRLEHKLAIVFMVGMAFTMVVLAGLAIAGV